MFRDPSQQAYSQTVGTSSTNYAIISQRDPTANDVNYLIGKFWINNLDKKLWYLNSQSNLITVSNPNGFLQSDWELISVSSELISVSDTSNTTVFPSSSTDTPPDNIQFIAGTGVTITSNPGNHSLTIESTGIGAQTLTGNSGGAVGPNGANNTNTLGGTTINVVGNAGTNTLTHDVVSTNHTILVGRGTTTPSVALPAGTNNTVLLGNTGADPSWGQVPNAALVNSSVTLNGGNNLTVTGSPLSLGGVASFNVTGTTNHSLLLGNATGSINNLGAATDGQLPIGRSALDPVLSTLTAGAGVSITNGPGSITIAATGTGDVHGLSMDTGTTPVVPNGGGNIVITGAQVATGTIGANVIRSNGTGANTATLQIQRTTTAAASDSTKNGVSHFDSSQFTVDANGFVTISGTISINPSIVIQTFSGSGTYTPTASMKYCIVECVGGGGGGAGCPAAVAGSSVSAAGGGGAGEYARGVFSAATIGVSKTVTIGSGGSGGSAGANNGANGGNTSLDALISANGGMGGFTAATNVNSVFASGGTGGSGGAGGSFRIPGNAGTAGIAIRVTQPLLSSGGIGGASYFGGSPIGVGTGAVVSGSAGISASGTRYGAGGGGAVDLAGANRAGGAGGVGVVIITEYVYA